MDARIDNDFVIMARTDAVATDGVGEAIERANLFVEADADLILVDAPTSTREMKLINDLIKAPTMANMIEGGKTPILTTRELQDIGYSVVCIPTATVYATTWALKQLWEGLKENGTTNRWADKMIRFDEFNEFLGLDYIRNLESNYYKDYLESLRNKKDILAI